MKICTKCKTPKELSEFNFKIKAKNTYSSHCRECSKSYVKNHYLNNRTYYLAKAKKRNLKIRSEIRKIVWDYLTRHSCVDCGENNPIVLEFDHIKGKSFTISRHGKDQTTEAVKEEIKKCEIRCANCHRIKTAKQFNWYRSKMPL